MGGDFRGKFWLSPDRLPHAISACISLVVLQTQRSPLKNVHVSLLDDVKVVQAPAPPRQYYEGYPLGNHRDLRTLADGRVVGVGREPSNRGIDTGMTFQNFVGHRNVRILIWWWNYWWPGKMKQVTRRDERLTVTFDHEGGTEVKGYLPRLVLFYRPGH